jgi:integrase
MTITMPMHIAVSTVGALADLGDYLLGALMLTTGRKPGELLALKVGDLGPDGMSIRSGRGLRIPAELREDLNRYLRTVRAIYEEDARALNLAGFDRHTVGLRWVDMPLFPGTQPPQRPARRLGRSPSRPLRLRTARSEQDLLNRFREAALAIGWRYPVHAHTLRHVYARQRLDHGVTIEALQEELGHNDLMTTLLYVQSLSGKGLTFTSPASSLLAA